MLVQKIRKVNLVQFKLTELYNTRYFYLTYRTDLTYLFSTFLMLQKDKNAVYNAGNDLLAQVFEAAKSGSFVEFDLANCKLTPDVIPVLNNYAAEGINLIDTKDSCRNEILRINRERYTVDKSQFVDLPEYNPDILVKDYIVSLSKDVTYNLPSNLSDVYIPLLFMILVVRPSIKINISSHCKDFFNFVGSRLSLADLHNYDEFYLTTPEGTRIVNFSKGPVVDQRIGVIDLEKALTVGTLVPTVLGREKLLDVPCWKELFQECLNRLTSYRNTRKQTLEDVLT